MNSTIYLSGLISDGERKMTAVVEIKEKVFRDGTHRWN